MTFMHHFATARSMRAVCFLGLAFLFANSARSADPATSPQKSVPAQKAAMTAVAQPKSAVSGHAISKTPAQLVKPLWAELTPLQRQALVPLASEWDKMDALRKKKWLELAARYPKMKPDEQQRIQERMRDWAKLTPEQRRLARESYVRAKKLEPNQKSAEWQRYQNLPEEQKKKLAAEAEKKKHVANLPRIPHQPVAKKKPEPLPAAQATPQAAIPPVIAPAATAPPVTPPPATTPCNG